VAVLPPNATVSVDGKPVRVHDGVIDVVGELDTKHPVRVRVGAVSIAEDVTITDEGAAPSQIALKSPPAAPARRSSGREAPGVALDRTAP